MKVFVVQSICYGKGWEIHVQTRAVFASKLQAEEYIAMAAVYDKEDGASFDYTIEEVEFHAEMSEGARMMKDAVNFGCGHPCS